MRLGVAGGALLALAACPQPGAPTDRPGARSAVLLVAEGVHVADVTCADVARALAATDRSKALSVADACAHGYAVARRSLLAAEAAVDAYDAGGSARWGCAVRDALVGLRETGAALELAGAKVPAAVSDGLSLASTLSGLACAPSDGGA